MQLDQNGRRHGRSFVYAEFGSQRTQTVAFGQSTDLVDLPTDLFRVRVPGQKKVKLEGEQRDLMLVLVKQIQTNSLVVWTENLARRPPEPRTPRFEVAPATKGRTDCTCNRFLSRLPEVRISSD